MIHNVLGKSFAQDGFDASRPQPGVCIHYKSHEKRTIAFTHGNTTLR